MVSEKAFKREIERSDETKHERPFKIKYRSGTSIGAKYLKASTQKQGADFYKPQAKEARNRYWLNTCQ